jgi:hypothetical protein
VTTKGKVFVVPGTKVGQTHSGSLRVTHNYTMRELAPGCKSIKQITNVTDPPTLSQPLLILISRHWISTPTSAVTLRRFLFVFLLPIFFSVCCLFSLAKLRLSMYIWHQFSKRPTKGPLLLGNLLFFLVMEMLVLLLLPL